MKTEIKTEELKELCFKQFLKRSDVQKLVGDLPVAIRRKIANEIGQFCEEELQKIEKTLPDAKYLPTEYVFKYLSPFGISKKSILAKFEYEERQKRK